MKKSKELIQLIKDHPETANALINDIKFAVYDCLVLHRVGCTLPAIRPPVIDYNNNCYYYNNDETYEGKYLKPMIDLLVEQIYNFLDTLK